MEKDISTVWGAQSGAKAKTAGHSLDRDKHLKGGIVWNCMELSHHSWWLIMSYHFDAQEFETDSSTKAWDAFRRRGWRGIVKVNMICWRSHRWSTFFLFLRHFLTFVFQLFSRFSFFNSLLSDIGKCQASSRRTGRAGKLKNLAALVRRASTHGKNEQKLVISRINTANISIRISITFNT